MKKAIHLLFLIPLIANSLNLQDWVALFMGSGVGQLIAYGNLMLILLGVVLIIREPGYRIRTPGLWAWFYGFYYTFSILASAVHGNPAEISYTLVNLIFFFGFLIYLSKLDRTSQIFQLYSYCFLIASIMLIYLWNIQLDLDYVDADIEWGLDRASGLYGDANNAALVAILAFIFVKFTNYSNKWLRRLKPLFLIMIVYTIFLTFSTTGFMVFIIILVLTNYKLLTKRNLLILLILLPIFYLGVINLGKVAPLFNLNVRQISKIENFTNILTFNFDKVDNSGRDEHISHVIDKLYENPWTGYGFDFGLRSLTHNTYLNIWLEAGIIGLLLLLLILVKYYLRIMQIQDHYKFFALAIMITITIFMLSLQTVINQPYIMVLLTYLGFLIDAKTVYHERVPEKVL